MDSTHKPTVTSKNGESKYNFDLIVPPIFSSRGKTSNSWKPAKAIHTRAEENRKAAEKTASEPELKAPRGKRSLERGGVR